MFLLQCCGPFHNEFAELLHLLLHRRHALSEPNPACRRLRLRNPSSSSCPSAVPTRSSADRTRLDSVPRFRAATTVRGSRSSASAAPARPRSRTSSASSAMSLSSCWSGAPPLSVASGLTAAAGLPPAGPTGSRGTLSTPCPALFPGIQNAPFAHLATGTSPTVKFPGTGRLCSPETPVSRAQDQPLQFADIPSIPVHVCDWQTAPAGVQVRLSGHHMQGLGRQVL